MVWVEVRGVIGIVTVHAVVDQSDNRGGRINMIKGLRH